MNSTKIIFAVAIIAFSCFTFSYSLKCYVCDSESSCKKPSKYACTPFLANSTRAHLDIYHTGVNLNTTSPYYQCYSEQLRLGSAPVHYKGCSYDNIRGCSLPLRSFVTSTQSCNQCSKDKCNPAGRASINVLTVFATVIVAFIVRYIWH